MKMSALGTIASHSVTEIEKKLENGFTRNNKKRFVFPTLTLDTMRKAARGTL